MIFLIINSVLNGLRSFFTDFVVRQCPFTVAHFWRKPQHDSCPNGFSYHLFLAHLWAGGHLMCIVFCSSFVFSETHELVQSVILFPFEVASDVPLCYFHLNFMVVKTRRNCLTIALTKCIRKISLEQAIVFDIHRFLRTNAARLTIKPSNLSNSILKVKQPFISCHFFKRFENISWNSCWLAAASIPSFVVESRFVIVHCRFFWLSICICRCWCNMAIYSFISLSIYLSRFCSSISSFHFCIHFSFLL